MTQFVYVGSVYVPVAPLAAHLYLQEAERMSPDAPNEWFEPRPQSVDYRGRVVSFLEGMDRVIRGIRNLPSDSRDEEDIQFHFYEAAKATFGEDRKAIREFFRLGYLFLFNSWSGPRWGQFVAIQGISEFIAMVENRLMNPILTPLENL